MKKQEPQSIGDIMSSFLRMKNIAMASAEGSAREAWSRVAGPYIFNATRDAFIKNGVLTLSFTNSTIRTEVMMHRRHFIDSMNRELGTKAINTIRLL